MVRKPDAPGTKPSALAGFRYFAHLEADAARDKVQKKAPGERTYEERWMTNVAAALKRREKLARKGVELDPTKSTAPRTKRSTTAAEVAAELEELDAPEAPAASSRRSAMRGARTSTEEGELESSDNSQARSSRRTRTAGSSRLGPAAGSSRNSTDEQEEPESSGHRRKPSRRTRFESDDIKGEPSSGTDS